VRLGTRPLPAGSWISRRTRLEGIARDPPRSAASPVARASSILHTAAMCLIRPRCRRRRQSGISTSPTGRLCLRHLCPSTRAPTLSICKPGRPEQTATKRQPACMISPRQRSLADHRLSIRADVPGRTACKIPLAPGRITPTRLTPLGPEMAAAIADGASSARDPGSLPARPPPAMQAMRRAMPRRTRVTQCTPAR